CGAVHALRSADHFVSKIDPAIVGLSGVAESSEGRLRLAIQLARAAARGADSSLVCCYFDESMLADGEFHEAMDAAAVAALPIVFVCDNNFYGLGTLFD